MGWFDKPERQKWAAPLARSRPQQHLGIPALDVRSQALYGKTLPRGVLAPRFTADRPPINHWMRPQELACHSYLPVQIILGKFGRGFIGHLDDRPMVTIAGARAGKTSTVLEPNLYLYPGSCVVLDPKGELTQRTAFIRRALGHDVYVLDPFGQSGVPSASFNAMAELDPGRSTIIDDVASLTQALIVDEGDSRAKHWNESARVLLRGVTLLTLLMPRAERNLVTVRQLLALTHPRLSDAVKKQPEDGAPFDQDFFADNRLAVETLLGTMALAGDKFGGILAATGSRFAATPANERGSIFSTAAAQTDFLDSLPCARSRFSPISGWAHCEATARPRSISACLSGGWKAIIDG